MENTSRAAPLQRQLLRTVMKFKMTVPGDHVLVAVSGGADSMALLLCLHQLSERLEIRLTAAHLNHRLRGPEADADAEFVRRSCADLGLTLIAETADLRSEAAAARKNLEEASREARYRFLKRAAVQAGADRIATGHTLDDQAETVLLRLLRGSGTAGLAGIQPVREGRIIRPLLECSRTMILEFLNGRGAAWREDATNLDPAYRRNRIRRELIPYLARHFNPRVAGTLAREAGLALQTREYMEGQARRELSRLARPGSRRISLPVSGILDLHPALGREVLRLALKDLAGSLRGIETVHIEDLLGLCRPGRSGRSIELPAGILARRSLEEMVLGKQRKEAVVPFAYRLYWPGSCSVPECGLEFHASFTIPGDPMNPAGDDPAPRALLNPDTLPETLSIRSRIPGDRYGGPGHRKVKKLLLAARIPLPERNALPMIAAGEAVIWIPGLPPAELFRARAGSRRSVLLEARKPDRGEKR